MPASVDIIIPVYNEETDLPNSIKRLTRFLAANLTNPWQITIADNASTDSTGPVSQDLCRRYANVNCLHLPRNGRGRAVWTAWLQGSADTVSYMDVDLSIDIVYFPAMAAVLESGQSKVMSIG